MKYTQTPPAYVALRNCLNVSPCSASGRLVGVVLLSVTLMLPAYKGWSIDPGAEDFIKAARVCDVDRLRALVESGGDPNERPCVVAAAKYGSVGLLPLLLEAGANPDTSEAAGVLCEAVWRGDLPTTSALVEAGLDPNRLGNNGQRPLCCALRGGSFRTIDFLLSHGARANEPCKRGRAPWDLASQSGDPSIVQRLENAGAKPSAEDNGPTQRSSGEIGPRVSSDMTLEVFATMYVAAKRKWLNELIEELSEPDHRREIATDSTNDRLSDEERPDSSSDDYSDSPYGSMIKQAMAHIARLEVLLEEGIPEEPAPDLATELLMIAIETGSDQIVERLLESGADPNTTGESGMTALKSAVWSGRAQCAELLLDAGARLEPQLLPMAAERRNAPVVKVLVAAGADPDERDQYGSRPVVQAALRGDLEVVRALVNGGAEVVPTVSDGADVFAAAAASGNVEIVRLLVDAGVPIDGDALTAGLCRALGGGSLVVAREYVDLGATLDHSSMATTPLSAAIGARRLEMVTELLEKGADPDFVGEQTITPITLAASLANSDPLEALLRAGADPNGGNDPVWLPLIMAARQGLISNAKLLLEARADPNVQAVFKREWENEGAWHGSTPLVIATLRGDFEMMKLLFSYGADPNLATERGITPLMLATEAGSVQLVRSLLEAGADPTMKDNLGHTALWRAEVLDLPEIAQLLDWKHDTGDRASSECG